MGFGETNFGFPNGGLGGEPPGKHLVFFSNTLTSFPFPTQAPSYLLYRPKLSSIRGPHAHQTTHSRRPTRPARFLPPTFSRALPPILRTHRIRPHTRCPALTG